MNAIPITVNICERPYKLMVNPDDEPFIREAARKINEGLRNYSQNYAFKDYQDLLSMVALQYTLNSLKNERELSYRDRELTEQLQQINRTLSI
ncbi:MAG: cell division protein ZapA [Bacteroides sp.]|nr:cell division protein ZapA [Bacteroides sp.]